MTDLPSGPAWTGLLFDAGLVRGSIGHEQVVTEFAERCQGEWAEVCGPLLVPDTMLAKVDRSVGSLGVGPLDVCVVSSTGAGGVAALADRSYETVQIAAVHSVLRDLDDPAGNVRRVGAAARALGEVAVHVGLTDAPGWEAAAETIDMEGLAAAVSAPGALGVTQMSFLVELDCPFVVSDPSAAPVDLAATVLGLVDQTAPIPGWPGDADAVRVRRRLHGVWLA